MVAQHPVDGASACCLGGSVQAEQDCLDEQGQASSGEGPERYWGGRRTDETMDEETRKSAHQVQVQG